MTTKEQAYGIIPLRRIDQTWEVLLICHQAGHWAFPKGHSNPGEKPLETAKRELKEEVGLTMIKLLSAESLQEHYTFIRGGISVNKTVTYFLAEVTGEVHLQKEEIADSRWVPLPEAETLATFPEAKNLSKKVLQLLLHP